tara:strand:+ start:1720 stop:2037 length:318 start_codon:yes stop_codon:yes gene_type:complete
MVNKNNGTNAKPNSVTIGGVNYPLTKTISAGNTARLATNNYYIANSIYAGATLGNIVSPKLYPNVNIATAISRKVLAKAGVTLNPNVFNKTGVNYFLSKGFITIS